MEPRQTCTTCLRFVVIEPDGRGFPPDIARCKLERICHANDCPCTPHYTPGFTVGPRPRGM